MIGAIIGDIAGSVYEFDNIKTTDFPFFSPNGNYTDDSVMTMAVADWLLNDAGCTHEKLIKTMKDFASKYPCPMGGYGGRFSHWLFETADSRPYNSWGNGSAMRVSAVGWLFDTLERTEDVAKISAEITHNHPEGIKGAQATAAAIFLARNGKLKAEIKDYIESKYGYDLHRDCDEIRPEYMYDESCQGTVPQAMVAFMDSTDFESAIRLAVSLGGDSDTLACITGGIAEAYYKAIPQAILDEAYNRLPYDFSRILLAFGERAGHSLKSLKEANDNLERTAPNRIHVLKPGQIFVFGSNLAGHHAGGAARTAHDKFGAIWGQGVGLQGQSYAIPTMQGGVETIKPYVDEFIRFAQAHPEQTFLVTPIGCGIAGFTFEEIASLFEDAVTVENIWLPRDFWEILR